MTVRPKTQAEVGALLGFRSGLEESIRDQLVAVGARFVYEGLSIPFLQPVKPRHYTPDFTLLNNGIIIETKGRFVTADRQKHLLVRAQHPGLDIRFVFSNPRARISKQSKTTYADWCQHKGFLYAKGMIPLGWIHEPPNLASLEAIGGLKPGG